LQGIDLTPHAVFRRLSLCAPLVAALVATAPAARAATPAQGQIYVTVVDTDGRPVTGLGSEDFSMREGAVRQPVLDAEPAIAPLSVAIVIDGFDAGDAPDVGRAVDAAARALRARDPNHRVSLLTGDAAADHRLSPVASDQPGVQAVVARLVIGSRGGLIARVAAACLALEDAPTDRRVVLAIVRRRGDEAEMAETVRMTDAVLQARAALWTVEVGAPVPPAGRSTAAAPASSRATLDEALEAAVRLSGSLREPSPSSAALGDAVSRVASLLLSQYLVTYTWPDPMLSQVTLTLRHDRGVVLAPAWSR
jgi:hypothetical protein